MATKRKTKADPGTVGTEADKWLQKITRAKKVREDWHNLFRIPTCYEFWEGRQRPSHIPVHEWITINMVYSNLMAELPSMYSTDPYFYIKVKKSYSVNPVDIANFEIKAEVRQAFLNYLKGELNLKSKVRLCIFDGFFQFGLMKVHLQADIEENPDKGKPILQEDTGLPMLSEVGELITQPEFLPANEVYAVTRVHPYDFLVDEDAGPLEDDVTWKAQCIRRPVEDVKEDKKYNKSARDTVKATELSDAAAKDRQNRKKGTLLDSDKEQEADTCVLWELYDLKSKEWMVVAEGCHEFMIDPGPLPAGIEGDPFVDLRFTLRDDSWYPLPPVSQWIDAQSEYCQLRSKVLVHRKRFNRKYEAYGPCFDDPEMALSKLELGEDGTVIMKNQPQQAVWPIADAPLDQGHMVELGYIRQDFMDLAVGPNQRGATAGVDSATEAGILESRARIREGDKQALVIDFMQLLGRKLDQLVQANITQDQAVKVTGANGDKWMEVRTDNYDEIAGEYEYQVDIGSVKPRIPEIERAQLIQFMTLFSNPVAVSILGTNRALMRKVASIFELDDAIADELMNTAQQVAQGGLPGAQSGPQGSMPGMPEQNPMAMQPGAAMGMANFRGGGV